LKILNALHRVLGAKFKLAVVIGIPVLIISVASIGFSGFNLVRNLLFTDPGIENVTVEALEDIFFDVFNVTTLEIESRNQSVLDIVPGGFVNPGTITLVLEYDSTVTFGMRDADRMRMRRIGDVLFVDSSSIYIQVINASVRNFQRTRAIRSNPLLRFNASVMDQIFEAQRGYEAVAAQRLDNARNRETAMRNFMSTFEAIGSGVGLTVIWE